MSENNKNLFKDLLTVLKAEVKPALGCTEPVAVGLGVAEAYKHIGGEVLKVNVKTSPNIFKNGMGVGIPGTKEKGLIFASALAITSGDSSLGLQVFENVDELGVKRAEKIVKKNLIGINVEDTKGSFYIEVEVITDKGTSLIEIKDSHTNFVLIRVNDNVIFEKEDAEENSESTYGNLKDYSLLQIKEFVENIPYEDIKFLHEGVRINMEIANKGLLDKSGPGLGAALELLVKDGVIQRDVVNQVKILTSAACDARMAGVMMPVMSSAGSGNHGLTAIIPPTVMCEHMGYDEEKLARTLAFSHLATSYIKTYTGRLSAVCGCAIAAGIGASASITWALGGSIEQIGGAIQNMVASLAGMVCDGAKGGCAFKLSTASAEAIIQAKLARANVFVSNLDGIIGPNAEQTIKNLGKFCTEGMGLADKNTIEIMLQQ